METVLTLLVMFVLGILHIQRDRIEIEHIYKKMVWSRLPFQKWFDPRLSWENKKSKIWIWQFIKSTVLVSFLDFKHFLQLLKLIAIFWFAYMTWRFDLMFVLHHFIAFGVGTTVGSNFLLDNKK